MSDCRLTTSNLLCPQSRVVFQTPTQPPRGSDVLFCLPQALRATRHLQHLVANTKPLTSRAARFV
eukprot:355873-Chlamydomonas_euryale.AAC.3